MSSAWYTPEAAIKLKRCLPSAEYDRSRLGWNSVPFGPEDLELIDSRSFVAFNQMVAMLTLRTWLSDRG